jgi:hypothetical protein
MAFLFSLDGHYKITMPRSLDDIVIADNHHRHPLHSNNSPTIDFILPHHQHFSQWFAPANSSELLPFFQGELSKIWAVVVN